MKVPTSVAEQHTERVVIRIRNKNVATAVMIDILNSNGCRPLSPRLKQVRRANRAPHRNGHASSMKGIKKRTSQKQSNKETSRNFHQKFLLGAVDSAIVHPSRCSRTWNHTILDRDEV